METSQPSSPSISGQIAPVPSTTEAQHLLSEQLALPLTDSEQAASWRQLSALHPGNRFRLMFGMQLLPQNRPDVTSR